MTLHEIYKLNLIHNELIHFVNTIKTEAFTEGQKDMQKRAVAACERYCVEQRLACKA